MSHFTPHQIKHPISQLNLSFSAQQLAQCSTFLTLLDKWNHTYNLVSQNALSQLVSHHLLDSLSIAPTLQRYKTEHVLDVGSGAGFPGIPLAIAMPEKTITLIEVNQKKAAFLRQAKSELGLTNIVVINQRVERWTTPILFDWVTSRAFAKLPILIALTQHLIARHGKWLVMKAECSAIQEESLPMNIKIEEIIPLTVPTLAAARHLLVLGIQNPKS